MCNKNAVIIRGTTPTIIFSFQSIDVNNIITAVLTVKQNNKIIVERDLNTATRDETTLSWRLEQLETLMLSDERIGEVCCDWVIEGNTRGRSKVLQIEVQNSGKNEVI